MKEINFKVKNFKSIKEETSINLLSKKVNILIGENGVGKTNFLDAIFYFSYDDKNEKSNTETTGNYKLDVTEKLEKSINYSEILKEEEINEIISILKEFKISTNFLPKKIYKNFTVSDKSFFGKLYTDENGSPTILSQIINKILINKKEILGEKFINETNNILSLKPKADLDKILSDKNLHQKEVIKNIVSKIYSIDLIFRKPPIIMYIKNAELENKTEFIYNLDSILKQEENYQSKDFQLLGMLNFIGGTEAYNIVIQICNLTDSEEDLKLQMKLKQNFKEKATKKIQELFKNFDIYAIPEVEFDSKRLIIKVKDRNKYWYNAAETSMNSSGYKSFFEILFKIESCKFLLTNLLVKNNNNSNSAIILADEPDKNLHPILQYQLVEYIRKTLKDYPNMFICYTTHSPFLIDSNLDNINIVNRNERGSSFLISTNNAKDINGTIGWYTFEIAKVLSNLNENHPLKILRNKFNVHYEGDENDDLMILKEKLGYQAVARYNLISVPNISEEIKKDFSIIKSLTGIPDLDDIDMALDKNQRVLILKKAYMNN